MEERAVTPERWEKVGQLYHAALEPAPAQRAAFLDGACTGDVGKSRQADQDFLALWKEADADLPVLIAAKKEYEKLK